MTRGIIHTPLDLAWSSPKGEVTSPMGEVHLAGMKLLGEIPRPFFATSPDYWYLARSAR